MVYIYGGAYTVGEATRVLYGPDYFMTKDVVVVTLNYRLDCFGESTLLGYISRVVDITLISKREEV